MERTIVSRRGVPWLLAGVLLALAGFAHRDLLLLRPVGTVEVPLSAEVENWFFEPSDTSPALVIAFVGWLLYRRWRRLSHVVGRGGPPLLSTVLFGLGLGAFWWAVRTGAHDLQAIALFLEGLAVANAFGGLNALRIAVVPMVFLVFAIPLPPPLLNALVWKFQIWTAEYSGLLLHLLGQPALVSGDQILRSDQVFQIIETCSGLRTAGTLTMLAVLMVDAFRRRGAHALCLIVAALPVAFVINGFRALTLIFNPYADIAAIHSLQGIVMLLAGVLILYLLDGGLERVLPQRPAPIPPTMPTDSSSMRSAWIATGAVVLLLAGISVAVEPWGLPPRIPELPEAHLRHDFGEWRGEDRPTDRMFLGLANFSHIMNRDYANGGQRVNVFLGTAGMGLRYRSFHSPKTVVPATGFIVEASRRERRDGRDVDVRIVRRGATRLLVHHWREGSAGLLGETVRWLLALDQSPFRRAEVPLVVRLLTPVSSGPAGLQAGERRLERFAERLDPVLEELAEPRRPGASGSDLARRLGAPEARHANTTGSRR